MQHNVLVLLCFPSSGSPMGGSFSGLGVSGNNFNASVAGTGTKTITYSYTDGNGCSNSATTNITVNALPFAYINSTSDCGGANTTLMASGGTMYSWSTMETTQSIVVTMAEIILSLLPMPMVVPIPNQLLSILQHLLSTTSLP